MGGLQLAGPECVDKPASDPSIERARDVKPDWGGAKPGPCGPGPMLLALWEPPDVVRRGKRFSIILGIL